jgi:hypothetical protein
MSSIIERINKPKYCSRSVSLGSHIDIRTQGVHNWHNEASVLYTILDACRTKLTRTFLVLIKLAQLQRLTPSTLSTSRGRESMASIGATSLDTRSPADDQRILLP